MRVLVRQLNDGVQSGGEFEVAPPSPGDSPRTTLHRKARSAGEKGWTVEWDGKDAFHAWKRYPENDGSDELSRKDRYFRLSD